MRIAVITEVPGPLGPLGRGNLAAAVGHIYVDTGIDNPIVRFEELPGLPPFGVSLALSLRYEVFTKGEILWLDEDGREPGGRGRKPSKWRVTYESFAPTDWESAVELSAALSL